MISEIAGVSIRRPSSITPSTSFGAIIVDHPFSVALIPTSLVGFPGVFVSLHDAESRLIDVLPGFARKVLIEDRLDLALRVPRWLLVHSQQPRQMPLS